ELHLGRVRVLAGDLGGHGVVADLVESRHEVHGVDVHGVVGHAVEGGVHQLGAAQRGAAAGDLVDVRVEADHVGEGLPGALELAEEDGPDVVQVGEEGGHELVEGQVAATLEVRWV